jgi:hypothetical protein
MTKTVFAAAALSGAALFAEGAFLVFGDFSWDVALERYGIPTLFLGGILYGIWRAAKWLGPEIVTPLKDATIGFISAVRADVAHQSKTLDELRNLHQDIHRELRVQTSVLERTSTDLTEVHRRVLQIPVPENVIIHTKQ